MPAAHEWRFEAIGTPWRISTQAQLPEQVRAQVADQIVSFDREWSRFRDDSLVAQLAAGETVAAPADAADMFAAFEQLSAVTDGAINPLVGASLEALGYDATYSFRPSIAVAAPADWRAAIVQDELTLSVIPPATVDVGALGKGRLVDLVHEIVSQADAEVFVDASGDLRTSGSARRVALEHPYDATRAIGVVTLSETALCASGANRRAWGDGLHHVLDARTGLPVQTVAATWAWNTDAMHADGLATALFFDGGPELANEWGASWVRVFTDGRADYRVRDGELELFS